MRWWWWWWWGGKYFDLSTRRCHISPPLWANNIILYLFILFVHRGIRDRVYYFPLSCSSSYSCYPTNCSVCPAVLAYLTLFFSVFSADRMPFSPYLYVQQMGRRSYLVPYLYRILLLICIACIYFLYSFGRNPKFRYTCIIFIFGIKYKFGPLKVSKIQICSSISRSVIVERNLKEGDLQV